MSTKSEIVTREEARLRRVGIQWEYIHVVDNVPVVIVSEETMKGILSERENGQVFRSRFVCADNKGKWIASYVDDADVHHTRDDLTERLAYRYVLGYKIGRDKQTSRYAGYTPKYRYASTRRTHRSG